MDATHHRSLDFAQIRSVSVHGALNLFHTDEYPSAYHRGPVRASVPTALDALDRPRAYPLEIRRARREFVPSNFSTDADFVRHHGELLKPRPTLFIAEHDRSRGGAFV